MTSLHIFVSGPLTRGDPYRNAHAAIQAATALLDAGHHPYLPHISALWSMVTPRDYETWMRLDLAWIARCDLLLRLPGESEGADREVAEARRLGVPVVTSVREALEWHERACRCCHAAHGDIRGGRLVTIPQGASLCAGCEAP